MEDFIDNFDSIASNILTNMKLSPEQINEFLFFDLVQYDVLTNLKLSPEQKKEFLFLEHQTLYRENIVNFLLIPLVVFWKELPFFKNTLVELVPFDFRLDVNSH